MIYRGPWFLAVVSKLEHRHTGRLRKTTWCWEKGEGVGEKPNLAKAGKPGPL